MSVRGAKPKDQIHDPYIGSLCHLPPHIVPKTRKAKYGVPGEECPRVRAHCTRQKNQQKIVVRGRRM